MNESLRPVRPLSPLAPYIGGKKQLSGRIIERIEAIPHETYAEGFLGMGGVFLRRRRAPRVEVVNDWSRDVATFFRILQRHYVPFLEFLKFQLTVRAEFERLAAVDPETLTDLERAARFPLPAAARLWRQGLRAEFRRRRRSTRQLQHHEAGPAARGGA